MNSKKYLQMLGMARRAGRLSMGHDMALLAVRQGKAQTVILASDISERLAAEFERAAASAKNQPPCIRIDETINDIHRLLGYKAGVLTVNDMNFSARITELIKEENAYAD